MLLLLLVANDLTFYQLTEVNATIRKISIEGNSQQIDGHLAAMKRQINTVRATEEA